ncbi:hypothetical protein LWI29_027949 [Acer saccharum]|uniref:NAC domain-containing protein n=1 Tax=Acer saccharum TaxID=4024 RepID=A0AA39VJF0_ACESA|nr:hypothetical protein LWI29_027949 [Acer saccharum]KAK1564748.1 hypothetical protein Q3G72_010685 [Acer saccharum]
MEKICKEDDHEMDLPPGFRFHPTDEELITHYLYKKVFDVSFSARAIGDVDLNKSEPWELPWKAKMGEKEWYFFCMRDRKYPTGLRTNRATVAGYWKATGKDKDIYRAKSLVGMKKTLVFYKGRAPKGEKTNWVMHEFRLEGKFSLHNLPKTAKNEWVICRVFQKSCGGKSGLLRIGSFGNDQLGPNCALPPLMDSSSPATTKYSAYVPCFSNPIPIDPLILSDNVFPLANSPIPSFPASVLRALIENNQGISNMSLPDKEIMNTNEISSFDDQEGPSSSAAGPVDLDCFWNY